MYVKVECLCGKILKLNECKSRKCRCGVVIGILDDGYFTPIATIPENSLEERIKSDKKVLNAYPVVVEYMLDGEDVCLVNQLEIIE